MDKIIEYLMDLYDTELHNRMMYSKAPCINEAKKGREKEYALALEHIAILEEIIVIMTKHNNVQKGVR